MFLISPINQEELEEHLQRRREFVEEMSRAIDIKDRQVKSIQKRT